MPNYLRFKFCLKFSDNKDKKIKLRLLPQEGQSNPVRWGNANKKTPKIYILRVNGKIIYVGVTRTSLSSRFGFGLRARGKGGYHGYAWKELADKNGSIAVDLFVYSFENEERTESIEAEIVYLVRSKTGRWPKYQTEIHFHQASSKEIAAARQIYRQVSAAR